jgi:hypothetical protein
MTGTVLLEVHGLDTTLKAQYKPELVTTVNSKRGVQETLLISRRWLY